MMVFEYYTYNYTILQLWVPITKLAQAYWRVVQHCSHLAINGVCCRPNLAKQIQTTASYINHFH